MIYSPNPLCFEFDGWLFPSLLESRHILMTGRVWSGKHLLLQVFSKKILNINLQIKFRVNTPLFIMYVIHPQTIQNDCVTQTL